MVHLLVVKLMLKTISIFVLILDVWGLFSDTCFLKINNCKVTFVFRTMATKKKVCETPHGHMWVGGDHHGHSFDSNAFGLASHVHYCHIYIFNAGT